MTSKSTTTRVTVNGDDTTTVELRACPLHLAVSLYAPNWPDTNHTSVEWAEHAIYQVDPRHGLVAYPAL